MMNDFVLIDPVKKDKPAEVSQEIKSVGISSIVALEVVDKVYALDGEVIHRRNNTFYGFTETETIPCSGYLQRASLKVTFTLPHEELAEDDLLFSVENASPSYWSYFGASEEKKVSMSEMKGKTKKGIKYMKENKLEAKEKYNNKKEEMKEEDIKEDKEDIKEDKEEKMEKKEQEKTTANGWNCKLCTYLNKLSAERCEMCFTHKCAGTKLYFVVVPLITGFNEETNPLKDNYYVIKFLGHSDRIWRIKMKVNQSRDEIELVSLGDSLFDFNRISENVWGFFNWMGSYTSSFQNSVIGGCDKFSEVLNTNWKRLAIVKDCALQMEPL